MAIVGEATFRAAPRTTIGGKDKRVASCMIGLSLSLCACFTYAGHPFVQDGKAGFVISHIKYALAEDASETGACPQGMSLSVQDIYAQTTGGKRLPEESDDEYATRLRKGGEAFATASNGQNLCMNPEAGNDDPHFHTVEISTMPVPGIDLDSGLLPGDSAEAHCEHADFNGINGETGIDNQFYRVVGCSRSFQSTGQSNGFEIEMLTGSWGILLSVAGIDDIVNDDHVEVSFFANADPIQLSPGREPLAYATYLADPEPGFSATTTGQIKDGILTTEPTDVQFHQVVNSMYLRRPLRDARLQVTLNSDGEMAGYLAGYTPVEAMYDIQYGYRDGKMRDGELAPLRLRAGSANGASYVLGHTCNGAYYALQRHADGHPDPESGNCTSISTQYQIQALPAFVIQNVSGNTGPDRDVQPEIQDAS